MKKFFELSISSRKTVKGKAYLTAETYSDEGEKLGEMAVILQSIESNRGVFFKYTPNETADCDKSIALIKLKSEDQGKIQRLLETFKEVIQEKMFEKAKEDFLFSILMGMLLSTSINPEAGEIRIPDILDIHITNGMICKYMNDEWLGIETKILPEVKEFIGDLAEAKREKEKEELKDLLRRMR